MSCEIHYHVIGCPLDNRFSKHFFPNISRCSVQNIIGHPTADREPRKQRTKKIPGLPDAPPHPAPLPPSPLPIVVQPADRAPPPAPPGPIPQILLLS